MSKTNIDVINKKLLTYQRKWFVEIVEDWVSNSTNNQKKKKHFSKYAEAIGFSEPFFTSVYATDGNLPKVLFVGQETNGWGNYSNFDGTDKALIKSQEFVAEFTKNNIAIRDKHLKIQDCKGYDPHIFWQFVRNVYDKTGNGIHIIWTELDKIQYYCGNKYYKLWAEDENLLNSPVENGKTLLLLEIETIKPDYIVFLTGPKYSQSMGTALDRMDIKDHIPTFDDPIVCFDLFGTPCLWTYHPSTLRCKKMWDYALNKIVKVINKN